MQIKINGPTVLVSAELKYPNQRYGSLGLYNWLMTVIVIMTFKGPLRSENNNP